MKNIYKHLLPAIMFSLITTSGCGLIQTIAKKSEADNKAKSEADNKAKSEEAELMQHCLGKDKGRKGKGQYSNELLCAVKIAWSDKVKKLLESGADVNTIFRLSSEEVRTPLSVAIRESRKHAEKYLEKDAEIVKLLLNAGADANVILTTRGETPIYMAAYNVSDSYGNIRKENIHILKEFFAYSNIKEFSKQVDLCIGNKPTHEQAEWLATNLVDPNVKDIDAYKRTKKYIDSIDDIYRELNREENYKDRSLICSAAIATIHDASEQLPYIYDYCNGDAAAFAGGICQDTAKQVLEGIRKDCPYQVHTCSGSACNRYPDKIIENFAKCIQKFQIVKDDYVASSEYFTGRIQKIMNDNSELTIKLHDGGKVDEEKAYQNFIYWNSPRGKCETRCNNEYVQKTDSWDLCMDICKDKRSDILE